MHCTPTYRFHIRRLQAGSNVFGDCEVCGKPVATVYQQIRECAIALERDDAARLWKIYPSGTAWAPAGDLYGHFDCLLKVRTQGCRGTQEPSFLAATIAPAGRMHQQQDGGTA
jgi:hypothetical protein